MPPSTRSRTYGIAPKVYYSSPVPQQRRFPSRRTTIKSKAANLPPASLLRQQTLTQVNFVEHRRPSEGEESDSPPPKTARPKKRRKTMGDTPSSSFHTQTMTQFLASRSSRKKQGDKEEEQSEMIGERELNASLDVPEDVTPRRARFAPAEELADSARLTNVGTPRHKNIRTEVPSSQPTPITPYGILKPLSPFRSPLQTKSSNVEAPLPSLQTIMKRPRNLVIQDSYSTRGSDSSNIVEDGLTRVSPKRMKREPLAEIPLERLGHERWPVTLGGRPTKPPTGTSRRLFVEVPDSDDDLDSTDSSPARAGSLIADSPVPATCITSIPDVGTPTQRQERSSSPIAALVADLSSDSPLSSLEEISQPGTPTPLVRRVQLLLPPSRHEKIDETVQVSPGRSSPLYRRYTQAKSQAHSQVMESQRVPTAMIRSLGPQTDRSDIVISVDPESMELIADGMKDYEFRNYRFPPQVSRCWIYTKQPVGEVRYMATLGPAKQPGEIDSQTGRGNHDFNEGTCAFKFAHKLMQVYRLNNPIPLADMKENGLGDSPPQKYRYLAPGVVGQLLFNLQCALFAEGDQAEHDFDIFEEELHETVVVEDVSRKEGENRPRASRDGIIQPASTSIPTVAIIPRSPVSSPTTSKHEAQDRALQPQSLPSSPASRRSQFSQRTADEKTRHAAITVQPASRAHVLIKRTEGLGPRTRSTVHRSDLSPHPSQATTASRASTPTVTPEKSMVRPSLLLSSSMSLPDFSDDGSPVKMSDEQFSTILSSQVATMPDSLLIEDARQPPVESWDSEDDVS